MTNSVLTSEAGKEKSMGSTLAPSLPLVRSPLTWVLIVGALLRLGLWLWFQDLPPHIDDEKDYNQLAMNLVQHGEYAFVPGQLTSLRPPLYPWLVAAVYSVFGLENYQAVRLLQAALSLGTVLVVYRLGGAVSSRRVGLLAAAFVCFYPSLLGYNNLLLTETLFTFLLCCFAYLAVLSLQTQSATLMAAAAVALGLAALTRSVVWLLPPVMAVFLLFAWRESVGRRGMMAATFVVAFAIVLAPWTVRNTLLQKTFVTVDVMGGRNFMMGNYEHTPLFRSWRAIEISGDEAWHRVLLAECPPAEPLTQGQLDKLAFGHGLRFVLANPGLSIQRSVVKFFDFWGLERELVAGGSRGYFGPIPRAALAVIAVVIVAAFAAALLLGIFGMFLAPPADRRMHALFVLLIVFVCGMHTIVFGHSRYHLPLMPFILFYAAGALASVGPIWTQRGSWKFWLASGGCGVVVAGWLWLLLAVDLALIHNAV